MQVKWCDAAIGDYSELEGSEVVHACSWQPINGNRRRVRSWETSIAARSEGLGLSLASGKVDAVMALRRDAEKVVEALGGKVVWDPEA